MLGLTLVTSKIIFKISICFVLLFKHKMHLTSFEISCPLNFFIFFQQLVLTLNYTSLIIGNYMREDCIESQWYLNSKEIWRRK